MKKIGLVRIVFFGKDDFSLPNNFPIPIILEDYNYADNSNVVSKTNNEEKFEKNSYYVTQTYQIPLISK